MSIPSLQIKIRVTMSNTVNVDKLISKLALAKQEVLQHRPFTVKGQLTRSIGLTLEAQGIQAKVGTLCYIETKDNRLIQAVVTGFEDQKLYLMPLKNIEGIELGSYIYSTERPLSFFANEQLLGRVLDGAAQPLDGLRPLKNGVERGFTSEPLNPLERRPIDTPMDVGVRTINSLLSVGQGQRLGLFAGSGVGKSVLMGMIARNTKADVVVVSLVGERGREVNDFILNNLGKEGLKRAVVVASPADYSPVLRLQGAQLAMSIAEYFRDQGQQVLLLMDSLTRVAQAQREIALAMGEPPATKGYPPSVFTLLPQLVERAGTGPVGGGSITGIFTVLAEGDDQNDPIVDAARAILDGHIVLTRKIADKGHFPAIDIEASISRVMPSIVNQNQLEAALRLKRYLSLYNENIDLINIGAYVKGTNPELDFACERMQFINQFLQQKMHENVSFEESVNALFALLAPQTEQTVNHE